MSNTNDNIMFMHIEWYIFNYIHRRDKNTVTKREKENQMKRAGYFKWLHPLSAFGLKDVLKIPFYTDNVK